MLKHSDQEDIVQTLKSKVLIELKEFQGAGYKMNKDASSLIHRNLKLKYRFGNDTTTKSPLFYARSKNGQLLRYLNNDEKCNQVWYFKGKIFAIDSMASNKI